MNHNHMSNHNYYKNPLEELSIVSLQEAHLSSMHSLPDGSSTIGFSESISDFDTSSATVGVAGCVGGGKGEACACTGVAGAGAVAEDAVLRDPKDGAGLCGELS